MFRKTLFSSYFILAVSTATFIFLSVRITEKDHQFIEKIERKKAHSTVAEALLSKENVKKEIFSGTDSSHLFMEYPFSDFSIVSRHRKLELKEEMSDIFAVIDDASSMERMIFVGEIGKYQFPQNKFLFDQVDLCLLRPDGKFLLRTQAKDLEFGLEPKNPLITLHDLYANFDALP